MTILQQLHRIGNTEIRQRAINNAFTLNPKVVNMPATSLGMALFSAFNWESTPEGQDYWSKAFDSLTENGTLEDKMFNRTKILSGADNV